MRHCYLILTVLGVIAPLTVFVAGWAAGPLPETGLLSAFFVNPAAAAASTDILLASLVFWVWMFEDCRARATAVPWWLIPVNLALGLCAALPWFLFLRATPRPD